jgi:hypothetical protein
MKEVRVKLTSDFPNKFLVSFLGNNTSFFGYKFQDRIELNFKHYKIVFEEEDFKYLEIT